MNSVFQIFLALSLATIAVAQPIRVPADYPTIQEALNVIAGNDTILVDTGEYAEVLIAPQIRFTLLGNVSADSGDFPRPTIDSSLLPDSLRDPCLTLPLGSLITVEKMRFRNRNAISPFAEVGGVNCLADSAIFRQCAFDSIYYGISTPGSWFGTVIVENCMFREDSVCGISIFHGTVLADHCLFDGGWGWAGMVCGPNSVINECLFRNRAQYLLSAIGHNITISDCVFGPSGLHGFTPVELGHFSGRLENCTFSNLQLYHGALQVEVEGPTAVSGNTFLNNTVPNAPAWSGIEFHGDCDHDNPAIFENNTVLACSSLGIGGKALSIQTCVTVSNNRFVHVAPNDKWTTMILTNHFDITFRRNIFEDNNLGLRTLSPHVSDARDNWWGDSAGPRAEANPDGLGDSVGPNILYEPWTTDTLDWISSADEEMPVIPENFEMEIYPNPFNASATLVLQVPEPTIIEVELFDMLGRRVKEIWSGAVAIEKKIHVDAHELPTGLYFARATEVHFRRPLATAKLLLIR